ncbi:centromere protein P [Ctenodactylus gundi]
MDAERLEVRALEAEIASLRRACERLPAPREASRVRKQEINQPDSGGWESSNDLGSRLGHLQSELSFLSMLTGLSIKDYSMEMKDSTSTQMTKGIKKVLKSHRLSGNCRMVSFQLEFQILEIQNKENLSSVITDLSIIMEPTEYSELSEFVSRVEERKDLFLFFRTLHFFVEWYEYRRCTFKHFKEKYPDMVHFLEGAGSCYMEIHSASRPGFELLIVWRIQIEDNGKVSPKLDLLTKVPQQALKLDKHGVIETAPASFRILLGVLGIEAAIESLIKLLCAEDV